jgi:hypothetical protein
MIFPFPESWMSKSEETICIDINKKSYMILLSACEQINNKLGSRLEVVLIPKDVIKSQIVNYVCEHTELDRDTIHLCIDLISVVYDLYRILAPTKPPTDSFREIHENLTQNCFQVFESFSDCYFCSASCFCYIRLSYILSIFLTQYIK